MEPTIDSPSFTKTLYSPELAPGSPGIKITIRKEAPTDGSAKIWLHGVYQVPREEASRLGAPPFHRALVITATSGFLNQTRHLVGEEILFKDDEIVTGGNHKGYFNYDLIDWMGVHDKESYYITVSIGKWLSNTVLVPFKMVGSHTRP